MIRSTRRLAWLAPALAVWAAGPAPAQPAPRWEWAGVPALNYDADEGFGYGAVLELYRHGGPEARPYRYTLQPTLLLTTGGRRDLSLFFDAPHLLPGGWRLDAFVGSEHQPAAPFYGLGNDTRVDPARASDPANPDYYRYARTRRQLAANLQHRLGSTPLRALVGAGISHARVDATPSDRGTTLLAQQRGPAADEPGAWSNHLRAGLVWDTRDREIGPRRGAWSELLVQRVDRALGSDHSFTRWTLADRRYLPVGSERLVLASRVLLQGVQGDAPLHELSTVQTSFKPQEGLGGAKTLRGLPKNRFAGRGMLLWNAELRWRAAEFAARGRPMHLTLSGFVDSGRVWAGGPRPEELASGLHHGYGGGARVGMGDSFVVALDVGHSVEAAAPVYVGLGYLF